MKTLRHIRSLLFPFSVKNSPFSATFMVVLASALLGQSCGDRAKELYLVEETRVPAVQFWTESARTEGQNCTEFTDAANSASAVKTVCQQFPLRPGKTGFVRFLVLAPAGETPEIEITKLTKFATAVGTSGGTGAGSLGAAGLSSSDVDVNLLQLKKSSVYSKVLLETPLRVEEVVMEFTVPGPTALVELFKDSGGLPGLNLIYVARAKKGRSDEGSLSFYILPDPKAPAADVSSWESFQGVAPVAIPPDLLARLKKSSATNLAPVLSSISPVEGATVGQDSTLELQIAKNDTDENAKSRVQWFVSKGEVKAQNSRKTEWQIKDAGKQFAVGIVRDLQGGVDYKFTTVTKQ